MDLFSGAQDEAIEKVKAVARVPEMCPLCGKMAVYVERFLCGRYMAAHESVRKVVRGVEYQAARICHGYHS